MKFTANRTIACAVICCAVVLAAGSCKKSNNNNSSNGSMTATINGAAWSANYPVVGSFTVAAGTFAIPGVQIKSGDTSAFLMTFNSPVTVDKAFNSDTTNAQDIQFQKGGSLYDGGALAGYSALTITAYDSIRYTIAGTFSGVLYNVNTGKDSLVVTGGAFTGTFVPQ